MADWAMAPLQETGRRDFRERYNALDHRDLKIPDFQWHEQIGDITITDGILDGL